MTILRNIDDLATDIFMRYARDISSKEYQGKVNASIKRVGTGRYEVSITATNRDKGGQFSNEASSILERVVERMRTTGYPLIEVEQ